MTPYGLEYQAQQSRPDHPAALKQQELQELKRKVRWLWSLAGTVTVVACMMCGAMLAVAGAAGML